MTLQERLRFIASGQDDPHSIAIIEAADALDAKDERIRELEGAILSWWKWNRPVNWTDDMHKKNPFVNLTCIYHRELVEAMFGKEEVRAREALK